MHLVHYLKKRLRARSVSIWASILFIFLNFGHAQTSNPFNTDNLISKDAGDTFDAQFVYYIKLGAKITITTVMLFGIAGAIGYLMSSFKDIQREGIGSFVLAVVVVFILVIITALLANFAWGWIDNLVL